MATIDVGVCGPALMWPQGPTLHTGHVFFGPCEFHVLPVFPLFLYLLSPPYPPPQDRLGLGLSVRGSQTAWQASLPCGPPASQDMATLVSQIPIHLILQPHGPGFSPPPPQPHAAVSTSPLLSSSSSWELLSCCMNWMWVGGLQVTGSVGTRSTLATAVTPTG